MHVADTRTRTLQQLYISLKAVGQVLEGDLPKLRISPACGVAVSVCAL